ncbi:MAG: Rrf2 family transcriptional regulator [Pirellulales bacterium]
MKLSAKTEYACIAMLDLAASFGTGEPMRIRDIADRHGIQSPQFLVQILLQLKGAGLVASTRGAAGGYKLVRPPEEISLGDVIGVMEGPADFGGSAAPDSPAGRVLCGVWREITEVQQQVLGAMTFAELLDRARHQTEPMYYI